ncbi:MAG TPA: S41 family peptidase [Kofleriaceae bacterium]|nr:S41 family peptidase [Kofleriaceae bacterium]
MRWIVIAIGIAACGDNLAPREFPPSSQFENKCATPRTGTDPITGDKYPDTQGTLDDEKQWLRSWIHELYLWYSEVPDPDPSGYPTAIDYFDVLKTNETTPSGNPKDRFHFTYDTMAWESLSLSGVEAGYGARWAVIQPRPPREVVVAYTDPGTPAAAQLARGAEVLSVDGVDMINGDDVDTLNAGLFPAASGESHTFVVQDVGAPAPRTITLVSADVTSTPVQNVKTLANGEVGYFQFNDHILTAESELSDAIAQLEQAGVKDLVIDLRYNGGGYLAIASEVAYEIAGPASAGKTFELTQFNDQYPTTDPVTGEPLAPTPFYDTAVFTQGAPPLPHLDLQRVFVLTGPNTCSASEAIMNALDGIDVQVIQIGAITCGKPYGFYPADNCGTTYFAIQFRGVNAKGFGDYADGFAPDCAVADDFTHALGDPSEARLAAALQLRATGTCPAPSRRDGLVYKPEPLRSRIDLRPPASVFRVPEPR